jgi:AMMECR1 domain-containing protein
MEWMVMMVTMVVVTVGSALEDTRFSPVTAREVPLLECQVSLLLNFTPANDCYDWTVYPLPHMPPLFPHFFHTMG